MLLIDDHTLFREGLAGLLRRKSDFKMVGSAANGEADLKRARELMPDLVLMDVTMAGMSGIEATRRIKADMPDIRIVMVTMAEDDRDLFAAIKSGAQGYILKNTTPTDLFKFIDGVFAGETPISGLMATKMLREFKHPPKNHTANDPSPEALSDRERQVLEHVAEGRYLDYAHISRGMTCATCHGNHPPTAFTSTQTRKDCHRPVVPTPVTNRRDSVPHNAHIGILDCTQLYL